MREFKTGGFSLYPASGVAWGRPGKTGGMSLAGVFGRLWGEPVRYKSDPVTYLELIESDMFRKLVVSVRNPFTRFASLWRYASRMNMNPADMNFDRFADFFRNLPEDDPIKQHGRPLIDYFEERRAFTLLRVVRVEYMQSDVDRICGYGSMSVPRVNAAPTEIKYSELYKHNPSVAQFVRQYYARDFGDDCSTPASLRLGFTYKATTDNL